jgi:outer membrane lipoprotein LolB
MPGQSSQRRWPALLLVLALTGCATTRSPPQALLDAPQQRDALLQLQRFSLTGRVGVLRPASAASESPAQGFNASLDWQQQQDLAKVKLSGPFGAGALQVEYSPSRLRVTGRGIDLMGPEAEQMLLRELGFLPPFDALRYWIRGVPAPGLAAAETVDASGNLQQIEQEGWLIRYERPLAVNTPAGGVLLPGKLTATREGLRLTLVVDRWRVR